MRNLDYIIFIAYLLLVVGIGLLCRGRKHSSKEFFVAGRSLGWFPVGISIMITAFSAINFNAFPSEVIGYGFYVVTSIPVFFLVAIPVTKIFIPFFYKRGSISAYEFLEERYDKQVRKLASGLFILWRILWMSVILYATAQILSLISGIELHLLIIICGVCATIYTAFGGIRAVIWTDVAQFFILFGGIIFAVIYTICHLDGGIKEILHSAYTGNLFKPFTPFDLNYFSLDPTIRISFWSCLIGVFITFLIRYGADQVIIQRYFTTKSLKDATRSFYLNIICASLSISLLALFGVVVYAYAVSSGTVAPGARLAVPLKHMAVLIKSFSYGGCGLLAAGLVAATMSSIDSGINACSAAFFCDFYNQSSGSSKQEERNWKFSIILSGGLGLLSIILALLCSFFLGNQKSVFVMVNKAVNGLGSPLLAVIILAMFDWKFRAASMFWGTILGVIGSIAVLILVNNLALHYYAVVNLLITILFIYAIEFFCNKQKSERAKI